MKDLGWVQKNLIPHLIDYTIECNYYSEGDFGSLYAIIPKRMIYSFLGFRLVWSRCL